MTSKVKLIVLDLDGTIIDTSMRGIYDICVDFV